MLLLARFDAYVGRIEGNRAGHLSETIRVYADYENANVAGSLTFDVPIANTTAFWVGKPLTVEIKEP